LKHQIQKQQLENEYSKIPESHRKSFAQLERKNSLKEQINTLDKQINESKLFIRREKFERQKN
jgi:hypothetical protein